MSQPHPTTHPIHLILLPGLDGTGELFAPLLRRIEKMRIAVDEPQLIAHALHYPTHDKLDLQQLQHAVEHYIAHNLPVDARYVILGESFSGPVSISVAYAAQTAREGQALGQRRCMGLILCCSLARNPYVMFAPLAPLWSVLPIELVPMGWMNRLAQGKLDFWAGQENLVGKNVSMEVFRHRLKTISKVDVTAELSALRMPVLYLQATNDVVVPSSCARLVQDCAPQTMLARIDSSHFLLQSQPDAALAHIQSFIAQMVVDGFSSLHFSPSQLCN
jgi:pimeloyl-ACP methyl ester carboxylesterase